MDVFAFTYILYCLAILCALYFTWKNTHEHYTTIDCPRRGDFLQCENIEDETLRELKCKSIYTHCQEQANKADLPESTIQSVL